MRQVIMIPVLFSPVGRLKISFAEGKLYSVKILPKKAGAGAAAGEKSLPDFQNLQKLKNLSRIPLFERGTAFQRTVWREVQKIPWGETETYGEIARRIGRPKAARAVGRACALNPFLIAVPCHRVTAAGGKLGGFALGLKAKRLLLAEEKKTR